MRRRLRSVSKHLLNGLAADSHLPRDVGLGEAVGDEALDQHAALVREQPRSPSVLHRLGAHPPQATKGLVRVIALHLPRMTTPRCHVNPRLSAPTWPVPRRTRV